ncbi:MAG: hypothetical protein R3B13_20455 [Polyangiaceae bacterium]
MQQAASRASTIVDAGRVVRSASSKRGERAKSDSFSFEFFHE